MAAALAAGLCFGLLGIVAVAGAQASTGGATTRSHASGGATFGANVPRPAKQPVVRWLAVSPRSVVAGTALPRLRFRVRQRGMERVRARVMELTDRLLRALAELRHASGAPLVRVYGPQGCERRGATVALNLLDSRGKPIDFFEVERRANAAGVSIRTGYFCNPGAAEFAFEHDDAKVRACAAEFTPESWDLRQFSVCLRDRPVGAVRVSLGVPTSEADLERFVEVVGSFGE
jgi:selenocysteine lyase/cysteine desulfurase